MDQTKLHLLAFPHTQSSNEFCSCGYTTKSMYFHRMFPDVHCYFNEGSEGNYHTVFTHEDQERLFKNEEWWQKKIYYQVSFNPELPYWKEFNQRTIEELRKYIKPGDIILNANGHIMKPVSDAFPDNITCEYGVGYEGIFSKYRVWESYAWMHTMYGYLYPSASRADGQFYDAVINNARDYRDFEFSDKKEDYLLFMGRPEDRKGIQIVREIAKRGHKVIATDARQLEGEGIEYAGFVGVEKRAELLSHAKALLAPTLYLEPWGNVAVEAQMSGTPAITTDWGSFTENVRQGISGFRCRDLKEFLDAVDNVTKLDYKEIREYAVNHWSIEAIKPQYEHYFDRLFNLYGRGFYANT